MKYRVLAASVVVSSVALGAALAAVPEPPDCALNPATGSIEVVDTSLSGETYAIRHVVNAGGQRTVVVLSSGPGFDDRDPRLAIPGAGSTVLAWWRTPRDGRPPQVVMRTRDRATGQWGAEQLLSLPAEVSARPRIAHDGTRAWVVYEVESGTSRRIAAKPGPAPVMPGSEDGDPIPMERVFVGETYVTGDAQLDVQAEAGNVWVTWLDGDGRLAWSVFDAATGTWSVPDHETAADGVYAARARVRARVLAR